MSKTEDEKKMSKLKKLQKCSKAITKSVNVKNVELDQINLKYISCTIKTIITMRLLGNCIIVTHGKVSSLSI